MVMLWYWCLGLAIANDVAQADSMPQTIDVGVMPESLEDAARAAAG